MKIKTKYRILEIIPGAFLWTVLILAVGLSFWKPLWVVYFIIIYYLFWFYRVVYFIFYLILSWIHYKRAIKTDWLDKVKKLPNWQDYYHIIYLPTYKESLTVLRTSLNSLSHNEYRADKMIVIVGFEGRIDKNIVLEKQQALEQEFKDKFFALLTTVHPPNLPDELAAKGANANWMGHRSKELIDKLNLPYEKLIVSYFDCDTQVHPKYFSCLTYAYLTNPNPTRSSYQPAVLYNNNIWDAPAAMRVTAFATVFWLFTELMRPERLYTFSSHSMSYKALVDVDFWQKDIVSDDSRIFLQCFLHYDGNYTVTPLYVPVSMDAVQDENYWSNYKNLYKQMRRWAWGVEHFPYLVYNFLQKPLIPFTKKFKYIFNLMEGMFSWASAPILIFILGRLPLWVLNNFHQKDIAQSFFVQNAPFLLEKLMILSMLGIFASALVSLLLLPKRPTKYKFSRSVIMLLQWLLLPITLIAFGSVPAIDAQTRLMLGKHLGFFVTPKARSK